MRISGTINKITAGMAFLVFLTGATFPSVGHAQTVTTEMLLEQLRHRDRLAIIRILNEIKKEGSQGDVVFVLNDIWNDQKEKYPRLNWELIETQLVRLNIADVLVQASRHGTIDLDEGPLREFAVNSLNSKDNIVVTQAVNILGFMESDDDVELILEVAKRFTNGPFQAAVGEFSTMCGERAATALDDLEAQAERENRISFLNYLRENRSRLQDYKDKKCEYAK